MIRPLASWAYKAFVTSVVVAHIARVVHTVEANPRSKSDDVVPHSYIVQFDPKQVNAENYKSTLENFYTHLREDEGWVVTPRIEYDVPELVLGASFTARPATASDAPTKKSAWQAMLRTMQTIETVPVVAKVHPNRKIRLDALLGSKEQRRRHMSRSNGFEYRSATSSLVGRDAGAPDAYPPHVLAGIDIQHKLGNYGLNSLVCLIDTPPDYSIPALNGGKKAGEPCLGDGCPVAGGIDWLANSDDGVHLVPGPLRYKGLDEDIGCSHGSHTGSIMIGNSSQFTGVVPQARMIAYVGFPCQGGKNGNNYLAGEDQHLDADDGSRPFTTVDIFSLSYQQAYKDGCPVVSGSFGSPGTWSGDLLDQIISKLATTNVSVVNSAGNSGGFGITQIGCPSCDIHSISVASVENDYLPGVPLTLSEEIEGGLKELNILSSSPWLFNESMPVSKFWFTPGALQNPELPDDGCDLSAVDIPDLTDTIVVLFRGGCYLADKVEQVTNKRPAKYVLVITDSDRNHLYTEYAEWDKNVYNGGLEREPGMALYNAYKKNKDITGQVKGDPFTFSSASNNFSDLASIFTSAGPDNAFLLKPDVAAVGGATTSGLAMPWQVGNFQGTSMSCPVVSGAIGLMLSVKGPMEPQEVRRRLRQTARPILSIDKKGLESAYITGSGHINITKAINLDSYIEPTVINLQDAPRARYYEKTKITIRNDAKVKQTYTFGHDPAIAIWPLQSADPSKKTNLEQLNMLSYPVPNSAAATVTFSAPALSVEPGHIESIFVHITPPADDGRINLYSGFITITSDHEEGSARITYGGTPTNLLHVSTFDYGPSPFKLSTPVLTDAVRTQVINNDKHVFSMSPPDNFSNYPMVTFIQQTPTRFVSCDVVKADIEFKSTIPQVKQDGGDISLLHKLDLDPDWLDDESDSSAKPSAPSKRSAFDHQLAIRGNAGKFPKYNDVPVVFNVFNFSDAGRSKMFEGQADEDALVPCAVEGHGISPKTGRRVSLAAGKYRIMIRSLKWLADDDESTASYDAYLSPVWEYKPDNSTAPAPAPGPPTRPPKAPGGSEPTTSDDDDDDDDDTTAPVLDRDIDLGGATSTDSIKAKRHRHIGGYHDEI